MSMIRLKLPQTISTSGNGTSPIPIIDQQWDEPVQPKLSSQEEPNRIPYFTIDGIEFQPVHRIQG